MTAWEIVPRARRDLREGARRIARDNMQASRDFSDVVVKAADLLARRPLIGTVRLDLLSSSYRFWSLRRFPYVIVYHADDVPLRIVRILHTARDLHAILSELDD